MERLTKHSKQTSHENGICCTHFRGPECLEVGGNCAMNCKWEEAAWSRLADYEDTGLEPEDLKKAFNESAIPKLAAQALGTTSDHLRDLIQAEHDGMLVVLPAKTVFELVWDAGPDCDLVCPVSIDGHGCCDFCDKGELCIYERKCLQEHIEQIGKTVFLTREEAEKALEAMKDD